MQPAQATEMLGIVLRMEATLDRITVDMACIKSSMGRTEGHLVECFCSLSALGAGLDRMDRTCDRIEAKLTRIENNPRLPH